MEQKPSRHAVSFRLSIALTEVALAFLYWRSHPFTPHSSCFLSAACNSTLPLSFLFHSNFLSSCQAAMSFMLHPVLLLTFLLITRLHLRFATPFNFTWASFSRSNQRWGEMGVWECCQIKAQTDMYGNVPCRTHQFMSVYIYIHCRGPECQPSSWRLKIFHLPWRLQKMPSGVSALGFKISKETVE